MEKIFCAYGNIPKSMEDGDIRLRLLKISDMPSMNTGLKNVDILGASGLTVPVFKSLLSAWWWLKKTYDLLYCIEVASTCVGFIGLYNLKPDRSAEMTLVIFHGKNRRIGYGTRAFNLLARAVKKYFLKIIVRVRTDNFASIAFWSKLGFKEPVDRNDVKIMSIDLKTDDERLES
jgi:N-acetylglutamate synthase-like GNAT family acetyltransferase